MDDELGALRISELIAKLQDMPGDELVMIRDSNGSFYDIKSVEVETWDESSEDGDWDCGTAGVWFTIVKDD